MPKPKTYYLSNRDMSNFKLIAPNKVLIEITEKNEDRKTKSGIILVSPTYRNIERTSANPVDEVDWVLSQNANRYGVVRQVPKQLKRYRNHLWQTTVEVQEGDLVWFDFLTAENCDMIKTDTSLYYLMDYFELYVVKRGEDIICLNGYCLFETVEDEVKSKLAIKTGRKDARYGILKHKGSCNIYYHGNIADDEMLQVGHKCVFALPPVMLESGYHAVFGGEYRISRRHNIMAYIDDNGLHATDKHVIVIADKDTHKGLIEIPAIYRKPNGNGVVYDAKGGGLKKGDKIKFIPTAGLKIDYKGDEYYVLHIDSVLVTLNN